MDFDKRLEEANARVQSSIQQEKQEKDDSAAWRQRQADKHREQDEAVNAAHAIAVQFMKNHVEPTMKKIQPLVRAARRDGYGRKEDGFVANDIKYNDQECISVKVHFDVAGITLSAEALCEGTPSVYHETKSYRTSDFDERTAKDWVETNAVAAYEAFALASQRYRNQPPAVTYKGATH